MADLNLNDDDLDLSGLGISGLDFSDKGDGSLGLDQEIQAPTEPLAANVSAPLTPLPAEEQSLLGFDSFGQGAQTIAVGLGTLASKLLGEETSPLDRLEARRARQRNEQLQMRQIQRNETFKNIDTVTNMSKQAAALSGEKRQAYINSSKNAIDKLGSPEATQLFEAMMGPEPTVSSDLAIYDKHIPGFKELRQKDPAKAYELIATKPEITSQAHDKAYLNTAQKKAHKIKMDLESLAAENKVSKELVKRAMANDGKVSKVEFSEILDSAKGDIKLTDDEKMTIMNHDSLLQQMGGVTDAADLEADPLKGSGKTVVDAQGNVVGTLVTTDTGGNMVQPPGGGTPRSFRTGEVVTTLSDKTGAVGAKPLSKKSISDQQKALFSADNTLDQIDRISRNLETEFLTLEGKAKNFGLNTLEFLGAELSGEDADFVAQYATFKQDAVEMLNRYINEITGAAIGQGQEEARLRQGIPDVQNDSPTQFRAKMQAKLTQLQVERHRIALALERGESTVERVSLSEVENLIKDGTLINKRIESLKAQNPQMTSKDLMEKVKREFPPKLWDEAVRRNRKRKGKK